MIEDEEVRKPRPGTRLKLIEVSDLTGVSVSEIEEMINAGVLQADSRGRLTSQAVEIVRYTSMLEECGIRSAPDPFREELRSFACIDGGVFCSDGTREVHTCGRGAGAG